MAQGFVTLGIPTRPWDRVEREPGRKIFGFFNVKDFEADQWKNEYPNAAFSRMTERDGAWMARILSHFTPEMVDTLGQMARFSDPGNTAYLTQVLEGRLGKILERYLMRLSPLSDVHLDGDQLCVHDLAQARRLRPESAFHFGARLATGTELSTTARPEGGACVTLPHLAGQSVAADDDASRYVRVTMVDGVAAGPLVVDLYDLGARGYRLAGVERPEP
jgi:hypothetical protein